MVELITIILPVYSLLRREFVLFYRQKSRIVGTVLQPLIFWIVIGSGLDKSFISRDNMGYSEFFFPGIILMVILFTSVFSTISIIEDRRAGFLQGVLVTPVSRGTIVLGKILGGTLLGLMQGILFLLLAFTPLISIELSVIRLILLVSYMFLIGFSLTGLGVLIAWKMDSIQGYHGIMSVVLFPLWIFSGAVFPADGVPVWLFWVMKLNPLSYGLDLMKGCLYDSSGFQSSPNDTILALTLMILFCLVNFAVAVRFAQCRA